MLDAGFQDCPGCLTSPYAHVLCRHARWPQPSHVRWRGRAAAWLRSWHAWRRSWPGNTLGPYQPCWTAWLQPWGLQTWWTWQVRCCDNAAASVHLSAHCAASQQGYHLYAGAFVRAEVVRGLTQTSCSRALAAVQTGITCLVDNWEAWSVLT